MTTIDAVSWLMLGLALSAVVVRVLMWCDVERAPEPKRERNLNQRRA